MEEKIVTTYALDLITEQNKTEKKRLWIALLIVFLAFVSSNVGWIVYESQYEDVVTETYEANTDGGGTAIANRDGEVNVDGNSKIHTDENENKENP